MKRITYRGHYYYYIWSFHSRKEAQRKADRAKKNGYRTKVAALPGRLGLYGLYTSPEYNTYRHKISDILD